MSYSVDVYYNANETVLGLVQKHVEEKYNVETTTCKGFLFLKSNDRELFNIVVKELEGGEHPYASFGHYSFAAETTLDFVNGEISEAELEEALAQEWDLEAEQAGLQKMRDLVAANPELQATLAEIAKEYGDMDDNAVDDQIVGDEVDFELDEEATYAFVVGITKQVGRLIESGDFNNNEARSNLRAAMKFLVEHSPSYREILKESGASEEEVQKLVELAN
ncbi:hypothetical protein CGH02_21250 [Vibrio parahaemolyticus]|nr:MULTISPECIES: hypothetical protein [Vibrio]EGS6497190.1 hypothetical protein [Vibrio parahaemolyticus]ELF4876485.1 hypothetical protein [Vibrio parahaemolyticus]MDF4588544.1 hypothetical protein [Vibrio parahaemolyticus]OOI08385.1 hypothetical protein BIW15_10900 [Vibrio sp. SALL6]TOE16210.1 hypothetical protein CGJ50_02100 [Vibrio parahaemolyticus]